MEFDSKCEVLHVGVSNQGKTCTCTPRALCSAIISRDRPFTVHSFQKVVSQMHSVVKEVF